MIKLFQMNQIVPDDRDKGIAILRKAEWDKLEGPRIGDFAAFPDGHLERFCQHWGDAIQTSKGGSYYLGRGYVSMSGGCNPAIPLERIFNSGQTRLGNFWFFHHDVSQAHSDVGVEMPCRVFAITEK